MTWKERVGRLKENGKSAYLFLKRKIIEWSNNPRVRKNMLTSVILLVLIFVASKGIAKIKETEVGVLVNNVTGSMSVEDRAGYRIYVPWVQRLYRFDRRVQSMVMTEEGDRGFRGGDAVKIKTADGSDVSLDILATYRIRPGKADVLLRTAGPDFAFRELWVRAAIRSAVLRKIGTLTTEQIYDTTLRNHQAKEMADALNEELGEFGLEILAVIPQEFRFFKEYEEIIKRKKLADQEVEEQQAQARLATEDQNIHVAAAEYDFNLRVTMAEGDAEKTKAEADGYSQRIRLNAEAALVTAQKKAEGMEAIGLANAEGLRKEAIALSGSGGVNLVALEYARRLEKIKFTGVPVVQEGRMGQYRIHQAPPASSCSGGTCGVGQ